MRLSSDDLRTALLPPAEQSGWAATWATVASSSPALTVLPDGQDSPIPAVGLGEFLAGERVWCLLTGNPSTHRRAVTVVGRIGQTLRAGDLEITPSGVKLPGETKVTPWSSVAAPLMTSSERRQGSSGSARTVSPALLAEAAIPVGAIMPYAGTSAPLNWVLCKGQALSKSLYPDLYTAIGDSYGASTATVFYVPDLSGKVPVGLGESAKTNSLGKTGGAEQVALSVSEMPSHNHGGSTGYTNITGTHSFADGTTDDTGGSPRAGADTVRALRTLASSNHRHSISSQGGGRPHENMPPYVVVNYIIRSAV